MANLRTRRGNSRLPERIEDWGRRAVGRPRARPGPSTELLVAGAVVVGLGYLAWSYLGRDLMRYLKIHGM
jgi:hypothetical protein